MEIVVWICLTIPVLTLINFVLMEVRNVDKN